MCEEGEEGRDGGGFNNIQIFYRFVVRTKCIFYIYTLLYLSMEILVKCRFYVKLFKIS